MFKPRTLLLITCLIAKAATAQSVHKCKVDGKVVFQQAPCESELETPKQAELRNAHLRELELKLDKLAAKGYGMRQDRAPAEPPAPAKSEPEKYVARTRAEIAAQREQSDQKLLEETEFKNAQSAADLTRIVDKMKEKCKAGELEHYPTVGMSDEYFRNCTTHARFGGVSQVVVSDDNGVPLRLYVFPTQTASRVYSVGGVITAVKPGGAHF